MRENEFYPHLDMENMEIITHVFSRPHFQIMKMSEKGEKLTLANKYVWSLSNFLAFLIFQVIIKKGLRSLSMLWIRLSELDLGDLRVFLSHAREQWPWTKQFSPGSQFLHLPKKKLCYMTTELLSDMWFENLGSDKYDPLIQMGRHKG